MTYGTRFLLLNYSWQYYEIWCRINVIKFAVVRNFRTLSKTNWKAWEVIYILRCKHSWGGDIPIPSCKRILSLILVITLILFPTPAYAAQTYSDPELARAVTRGFGAYRSGNPAVTYAQFMKMIDRTIELADKSKLAGWKAKFKSARTSKKVITRFEGMMIVLNAANTLGKDYAEFNADWSGINDKIGEKVWNEIDKIDDPYKYIPNHNPYGGVGFENARYVYEWDDCGVAYRYAFGRVSLYSGKTLFDYDTAKSSMRPDKKLLYTEALLAALRLYDSSERAFPVTERSQNADDLAILDKAGERKQAILGSPTTVAVTGTKYYVSNSGNDNNDGLSPDEPWATLEKIRWALDNNVIKSGDGIFLERGGLWRGSINCWGVEGVTYSAYGIGEKPRIYGSLENGAGAAKWILWYEKKGVKIWKFYKDISDCGGIVFNNGKSYGWSSNKHYHTWIDKTYDGNAITWWEGPFWNKGGTVSKNVLYKAKYSLVQFGAIGKNRPVFDGNVFAQNNNGIIAYISPTNDKIVKTAFRNIDSYTAKVIAQDYLGDKTAKVLPPSR